MIQTSDGDTKCFAARCCCKVLHDDINARVARPRCTNRHRRWFEYFYRARYVYVSYRCVYVYVSFHALRVTAVDSSLRMRTYIPVTPVARVFSRATTTSDRLSPPRMAPPRSTLTSHSPCWQCADSAASTPSSGTSVHAPVTLHAACLVMLPTCVVFYELAVFDQRSLSLCLLCFRRYRFFLDFRPDSRVGH